MRREKRQAEEINRKERRKGQPLGSTINVPLPTQNPLWIMWEKSREEEERVEQ